MGKTIRMEIHTGEGGADAAAFAGELADALARHASTTVARSGGALVLDRL